MDFRVEAAVIWPGEEEVEVEMGGEEKDLSSMGGRDPEREGERWFGREVGAGRVGSVGKAVVDEEGDALRGSRSSKLLSEEATEPSRRRFPSPSSSSGSVVKSSGCCFPPSPSIS